MSTLKDTLKDKQKTCSSFGCTNQVAAPSEHCFLCNQKQFEHDQRMKENITNSLIGSNP